MGLLLSFQVFYYIYVIYFSLFSLILYYLQEQDSVIGVVVPSKSFVRNFLISNFAENMNIRMEVESLKKRDKKEAEEGEGETEGLEKRIFSLDFEGLCGLSTVKKAVFDEMVALVCILFCYDCGNVFLILLSKKKIGKKK